MKSAIQTTGVVLVAAAIILAGDYGIRFFMKEIEGKVDAQEFASLKDRVAKLEQRPMPTTGVPSPLVPIPTIYDVTPNERKPFNAIQRAPEQQPKDKEDKPFKLLTADSTPAPVKESSAIKLLGDE